MMQRQWDDNIAFRKHIEQLPPGSNYLLPGVINGKYVRWSSAVCPPPAPCTAASPYPAGSNNCSITINISKIFFFRYLYVIKKFQRWKNRKSITPEGPQDMWSASSQWSYGVDAVYGSAGPLHYLPRWVTQITSDEDSVLIQPMYSFLLKLMCTRSRSTAEWGRVTW